MYPVTRRFASGLALATILMAGCQATVATASGDSSPKIAPAVAAALSRLETGLPLDPHEARSDADGRLQVYVYVTDISAGSVQALAASGLKDAMPSPPLGLVQGWIAPKDVSALVALPVVVRITLPRYASHY